MECVFMRQEVRYVTYGEGERMKESAYWHNYMREAPPEAGEYLVAYHPARWSAVDRSKMEVGLDHYR